MDYEVSLLVCSECNTKKKLSIFQGENDRETYCIKCNKSTLWKKVIDPKRSEGGNDGN